MEKLDLNTANITIHLIGNKWRILIIQELFSGTKRFSEIKKTLGGITQKVLTDNLRAMEASGLITRTIFPNVPPKVEYSLTELGYSLYPIITELANWGKEYSSK